MEERSTLDLSKKSIELIPPMGAGGVGRTVFRLLEKVLLFKGDQDLPGKWHRCYELTKGKHWRNPSKKVVLVTANLIYTHRERSVAMLTDNNPTFNVKQAGEIPEEKKHIMDTLLRTCQHWWTDQEQQGVLEESVTKGETYGIAIEKVRFDEDQEYGLGEVVTDVIDPMYFGWYPVRSRPEKAEAQFHYWAMPVREARRRWPDMADKIVPDREWVTMIGDKRLDIKSNLDDKKTGNFVTSILGALKLISNNADDGADSIDDEVLIVECWVRDYSRIVVDGQEVDLYPGNIRCVWTCNGGEVVLDDRPNPSINWEVLPLEQASQTYLFSRFPFNIAYSINDNENNWGTTDQEQLESLNMEINKTLSQITMHKDKTSRIKIINPQNSGVSNNQLTNNPGYINPTNHIVADAIRYLDSPQIPEGLTSILTVYRELFFLISGAFDLEQGKTAGEGAIAYKAIAALLERVATLLRRKLRNYHRLIRNRGRMYLSCAMNWYVEQRWISYEEDGESMSAAITGADLIIPAKLEVVSGSTLPVSKVQQREEAITLYDKGAIDQRELLKKMEWEDWNNIANRMEAGVVGSALDRFQQLGLPPEITQYMAEVAQMDEKTFDSELEKGELPTMGQLLDQLLMQQQQGEPPPPPPVEQAEIQVKQAQAEKVYAEIDKLKTEIQDILTTIDVKRAGVEFDREKLAIERARTANDISRGATQDTREDVKTQADIEQRARMAEETKTKESKQKAQGPYREKGLASNNQKP